MTAFSDGSLFTDCTLCPRMCHADRKKGAPGRCGVPMQLKAARAGLHMWEEPCISGKEGSGAVFFSGCSLGCVYCQNREIAQGRAGTFLTKERLSEIFLELQEKGANNINLVTAAHYVPQVADAIGSARKAGLSIPMIYNSSGYERVETLQMLDGLIDVYLPDLKYMDAETAGAYSRASDYPETAAAAIAEMVRQTGAPVFDERGMIRKGVIVRHLLLPGHVKNAKAVIRYLYSTYGDSVYISIMSQYTPMSAVKDHPLLGRRVTKREYERVLDYAVDIGVVNGFYQDRETADESFIPAFDGEGINRNT